MKANTSTKKSSAWTYLKKYYPLYLMLLIPMAYIILFRYVPMWGIQLAFKKYNIFKGMSASPWVGFQWFAENRKALKINKDKTLNQREFDAGPKSRKQTKYHRYMGNANPELFVNK